MLDGGMALRRALLPLFLGIAFVLPLSAHAGDSMESQVFGYINAERSTPLIEHPGLLGVAEQHSQEMASRGGLDHDDADQRISSADPDFEPASWCENVTYSTGFPESEVAQRLYEQWHRSAPHQACMVNKEKNVGAVGIYFDGSTWWATFIAEIDRTPPGGAAPKSSKPAKTVATKTADKRVAPSVEPTEPDVAAVEPVTTHIEHTTITDKPDQPVDAPPARYVTLDIEVGRAMAYTPPSRSRPPRREFGAAELALLTGIVGLASLIALWRSAKRTPRVTEDVPVIERELVGV